MHREHRAPPGRRDARRPLASLRPLCWNQSCRVLDCTDTAGVEAEAQVFWGLRGSFEEAVQQVLHLSSSLHCKTDHMIRKSQELVKPAGRHS